MNTRNWTISSLVWTAAVSAAAIACAPAVAQMTSDTMPRELQGIDITERLNESVPLELEFLNERGEVVRLGDFFEPGKPVILTLNYYTCPMLCHLTLNGLVAGLRDIEWVAGNEFQIVTVSFKPEETPAQAAAFKQAYINRYDREGVDAGWHFLADKDDNARKLADAIGFGYRYVPETGEWAHSSSIQFITPDGRISRYMNDVMFEPRDLRYALVESSQGSIGSPMDRLLLFTCFRYDPNSNSYTPAAWKIMRSGGALTILIVAIGLLVLWRRGSAFEKQQQMRPAIAAGPSA